MAVLSNVATRFIALLIGLFVVGCAATSRPCLLADRKTHRTRLSKFGPAPVINSSTDPAEYTTLTEPRSDAERVEYTSDGMTLFGYVMRPEGAGPFPAVLYAHSGFNLRDFDIDNARALASNGYVVFVPAWRAENGNPGNFEMWYGELNDAVAAIGYLRALPGVDPKRVYAAGHSAGGTLVILLAEIDAGVRAVAASGAPLSAVSWPWTPFDINDSRESCLRSASDHVGELRSPVALFYGATDEQPMLRVAEALARKARGQIAVRAVANGDHGSAMRLAIPQIVAFFLQH